MGRTYANLRDEGPLCCGIYRHVEALIRGILVPTSPICSGACLTALVHAKRMTLAVLVCPSFLLCVCLPVIILRTSWPLATVGLMHPRALLHLVITMCLLLSPYMKLMWRLAPARGLAIAIRTCGARK